MLTVVADEAAREDLAASLDEIVREGARRMLAAALEDEVAAYLAEPMGGPDGSCFGVRLDAGRVCTLVIIGVRADGKKELAALAGGHREPAESWAGLLRDCKRRGMRAPVLAVGDGALGFWAALAEVFPETREQRCWFHKIANVLGALPKSAHPGAKKALAEIWNAEDRDHASRAAAASTLAYR